MTADEILSSEDRGVELVPVPRWGGDVYLQEMTGTDREEWERLAFGDSGDAPETNHHRASLLVYCLCDQDGNRIFSNGQIGELSRKNAAVLLELYKRAAKLNALRTADEDEAAKNS